LIIMPWHAAFPARLESPAPPVREKTIEIANALLREGYDEGSAIRIAIAKVKEWAVWDPNVLGNSE
jgi:uncharacterized protein YdaT